MTPGRLRECLAAVRWSQRSLAEALGGDERLVRRWAAGSAAIPESVAAWMETLALAHDEAPPPTNWRKRAP